MICTQVTQISHSTVGSSFSVSFSADSTPNDLEMLRMMREWFVRWNNSGVSFTKADTPQTDCDTCKYGKDKHRYAHICNECGVGINNYTPQTETSTNDEKLQLAVEPQTDCGWGEPR